MKRLLLFVALVAWSGMAGAVVYKWLDGQGKVHYGDRPPDGVHAEVVVNLGSRTSQYAPVRTSVATTPPAAALQNPPPQDDSAVKKAVAADVAESQAKECVEAQERYRRLIEGRRLFKTGNDGQRQYLTTEEIDAQRLEAKRDIDSICNSPT